MFTFIKSSTCPLHSKCGNRVMHAFRVQYIFLIIAFYTLLTFIMLCFYKKKIKRPNGLRRLAQIVTETCAAVSRRLNVFLSDRSQVKVAQNSFQHIPRLRLCCVIITTLYKLMLQSWYQKTAQSLVNMLVLFS